MYKWLPSSDRKANINDLTDGFWRRHELVIRLSVKVLEQIVLVYRSRRFCDLHIDCGVKPPDRSVTRCLAICALVAGNNILETVRERGQRERERERVTPED